MRDASSLCRPAGARILSVPSSHDSRHGLNNCAPPALSLSRCRHCRHPPASHCTRNLERSSQEFCNENDRSPGGATLFLWGGKIIRRHIEDRIQSHVSSTMPHIHLRNFSSDDALPGCECTG